MKIVKTYVINSDPSQDRVVVACNGEFPVFAGSDPNGAKILCGNCNTVLADKLSIGFWIYDLAMRCQHCSLFSIATSGMNTHLNAMPGRVLEFAVSGVILLESPIPIEPTTCLMVDGSRDRALSRVRVSEAPLKDQLAAIVRLGERLKAEYVGIEFFQQVLGIVHEFAFYARQHARALQPLDEEAIRDLLLITMKIVLDNAEGEAFHFSGKTDIKVVNPKSKFEFGIIELKWWSGDDSFVTLYSQCVREHVTGQETFVFACVLSKNRNVLPVRERIIDLFNNEVETISLDESERIVKSDEIFMEGRVKIRRNVTRIIVSIFDLFYQNVRQKKS